MTGANIRAQEGREESVCHFTWRFSWYFIIGYQWYIVCAHFTLAISQSFYVCLCWWPRANYTWNFFIDVKRLKISRRQHNPILHRMFEEHWPRRCDIQAGCFAELHGNCFWSQFLLPLEYIRNVVWVHPNTGVSRHNRVRHALTQIQFVVFPLFFRWCCFWFVRMLTNKVSTELSFRLTEKYTGVTLEY